MRTARSEGGRSNRGRAWSCRPTDKAYRRIVYPGNMERSAERQRFDERQFDRGPGKNQCAQRRDFMGRRGARRRQRRARQPADMIVVGKLAPGPTFVIGVIDRDALTLECLGIEPRVGPRLAAKRRLRCNHLHRPAFDKARRFHFAFEIFCRDIFARRRHSRIKGLSHSAQPIARRARAPPDIRRLPDGPIWQPPSKRTDRNAPRSSY